MCLSDAALVLEVDAAGEEALVEIRGSRRHLFIGLLTLEGRPVTPGDWVLACAGRGVDRLGQEEAEELVALTAQARDEAAGP